ncbi:hypothetical protein POM88_024779 [Heracleum sosnowskyi]|uniref:Uncharacterized protein n=1 Tax=Heracleum sosnowskyi TaxID=360622 RepID=A0AAD8I3N6_9APIA|nr:hypothetical protein POM88_024779 [Heracleum sosnowskyi]
MWIDLNLGLSNVLHFTKSSRLKQLLILRTIITYGKEKRIFLSEEELHVAHTYILLNCEEVEEYVRVYDGELKMKHPGITDKDIEINRAKGFALWIKDKMASQASTTTLKKRGLGRGPNNMPRAPTNIDERTLIQIRLGPNTIEFADPGVVKCISQMCLQNWPTSAITWAATPAAHKDGVWSEFLKRYRWADEDGSAITTLFWQKCATRMKDNLSKERRKTLQNAGADHAGNDVLHMHEYSPWWCSVDIWTQMCDNWREEDWIEKRSIASNNRFTGAPSADKAKGTFRGGSISQLHHIANKEAESEGTPIQWLDVYESTRDGLPDAQKIARYPEGTKRPDFDQELWEMASVVRKNYIKDCVRAICADPELLRILGGHLGALDPDVLARAVAEATTSQRVNGNQGDHHDDQEGESGGS